MSRPSFDVVISSYRRPEMTLAAVRSCLGQGPHLNRIIVVDDASKDGTAERIREIDDARVLVHVRAKNGGVGAARRDGFDLSRADWTVSLDSDHELLAGAIDKLAMLAAKADPDVGILGARYRWDTGGVTPETVPSSPIGYRERIIWAAQPNSIGMDYLCAVASWVREKVKWPAQGPGSTVDSLFQLDAAQVAKSLFTEECLAYQKSDAAHGYTRGTARQRLVARERDAAAAVPVLLELLRRHGDALRKNAPSSYASTLQVAGMFSLLSGRRKQALKFSIDAIYHGGVTRDRVGLLLATTLGQTAFRWLYLLRGQGPQSRLASNNEDHAS